MVENINVDEMPEDDLEVFSRLAQAISNMGWDISIDERGDEMRGMIIGTEEYVKEIIEQLNINEN